MSVHLDPTCLDDEHADCVGGPCVCSCHFPGRSSVPAHVFAQASADDPLACMCEQNRYTGVHIGADCGHPDIDPGSIRRHIDEMNKHYEGFARHLDAILAEIGQQP